MSYQAHIRYHRREVEAFYRAPTVSEQLRFSQLSKNIPGITNTVLSGCLRDMEKDGIILRHQFNEIPPHVEYSLTEKGRTLSNVLLAIADWGMEN